MVRLNRLEIFELFFKVTDEEFLNPLLGSWLEDSLHSLPAKNKLSQITISANRCVLSPSGYRNLKSSVIRSLDTTFFERHTTNALSTIPSDQLGQLQLAQGRRQRHHRFSNIKMILINIEILNFTRARMLEESINVGNALEELCGEFLVKLKMWTT